YASLRGLLPEVEIIEVPESAVSLADAIQSYLFNAQLVALPDGAMALVLPEEARANAAVWHWLQALVAGNGPIRRLEVVDVRESMS
ncbi:N-succinylarginine dihydrolase, partial [Acinetobacter baumannii]